MDWLLYFKENRSHRVEVLWEQGVEVDPRLRDLLVRSLKRFQKGESGDGAHLRLLAERSGNRSYAEAVELFVAEEQEHAALMARAIESMGGRLLARHWSDRLFRLACLVSNLPAELMVILVAETIALRFFRALHQGVSNPVLRAAFAQIGQDERGHILFHCQALRPGLSTLPVVVRGPLKVGWRLFFSLVCLLVLYDHGPLLWEVEMPAGRFWHSCQALFGAVERYVFAPVPSAVAQTEFAGAQAR